jgi:hypothetical protein
MTLKELRKQKLSLEELKNIPLNDVYGYWRVYYNASEGEPWRGGKREYAYDEFQKAYNLTKEIESKFTVKQESKVNKDLGYKGLKASYNELISTL